MAATFFEFKQSLKVVRDKPRCSELMGTEIMLSDFLYGHSWCNVIAEIQDYCLTENESRKEKTAPSLDQWWLVMSFDLQYFPWNVGLFSSR